MIENHNNGSKVMKICSACYAHSLQIMFGYLLTDATIVPYHHIIAQSTCIKVNDLFVSF